MSTKPIYVLAKWQVKEESLETVLGILPELIEKTLAEEGNTYYRVHQSHSDTHTLYLMEGYKSELALDLHRGSEHFKKLVIQQIVPLLDLREVVLTTELFQGVSLKHPFD